MSALPSCKGEGKICDLYIGKTGTGKSTLCYARAKHSHQYRFRAETKAKIGTTATVIGESKDGALLCDTRGFCDADMTDEQIALQILRKIFVSKATKLRVIWCVDQIDRPSDDLTKQAKFIASLIPKGADKTSFWRDSVALVLKGSKTKKLKTGSPELVAPIKLAAEHGGSKGIYTRHNIRLYESMVEDDQEIYDAQIQKIRLDKFGVVKKSELAWFQSEYILNNLTPFKVIKTDDRCVKCGLTGDYRLWEPGCHAKFHYDHPGEYRDHHKMNMIGATLGAIPGTCTGTLAGGGYVLASLQTAGVAAVGAVPAAIAGTAVVVGMSAGAFFGMLAGAAIGDGAASALSSAAGVKRDPNCKWTCCNEVKEDIQGCKLRCSECLAWKNERVSGQECNANHQICQCEATCTEDCKCKVDIC